VEPNPYQPPAELAGKLADEHASSAKPKVSRGVYWLCVVATLAIILPLLFWKESFEQGFSWARNAPGIGFVVTNALVIFVALDYGIVVPFLAKPPAPPERLFSRARLVQSFKTIAASLVVCHFLGSISIWALELASGMRKLRFEWPCAWPAFALLAISVIAFIAAIGRRRWASSLLVATLALSVAAFAYDICFERWQEEVTPAFRVVNKGPWRTYYTWWWYDWDLILTNRGH
jgi:hypothetical protein